jgi:hypothetical protein
MSSMQGRHDLLYMPFVCVPNGDYVIGLERRGEEGRGEERTATMIA